MLGCFTHITYIKCHNPQKRKKNTYFEGYDPLNKYFFFNFFLWPIGLAWGPSPPWPNRAPSLNQKVLTHPLSEWISNLPVRKRIILFGWKAHARVTKTLNFVGFWGLLLCGVVCHPYRSWRPHPMPCIFVHYC